MMKPAGLIRNVSLWYTDLEEKHKKSMFCILVFASDLGQVQSAVGQREVKLKFVKGRARG